jgi:hypothetical protein
LNKEKNIIQKKIIGKPIIFLKKKYSVEEIKKMLCEYSYLRYLYLDTESLAKELIQVYGIEILLFIEYVTSIDNIDIYEEIVT